MVFLSYTTNATPSQVVASESPNVMNSTWVVYRDENDLDSRFMTQNMLPRRFSDVSILYYPTFDQPLRG
jgi:hypothetical protein